MTKIRKLLNMFFLLSGSIVVPGILIYHVAWALKTKHIFCSSSADIILLNTNYELSLRIIKIFTRNYRLTAMTARPASFWWPQSRVNTAHGYLSPWLSQNLSNGSTFEGFSWSILFKNRTKWIHQSSSNLHGVEMPIFDTFHTYKHHMSKIWTSKRGTGTSNYASISQR